MDMKENVDYGSGESSEGTGKEKKKDKKIDVIEQIIKDRKKENKDNMSILYIVRVRILLFMFSIIGVGLLIPYCIQFLPKPLSFKQGVEMWNSYVSIILGIVATMCSLLSIYLAFYAQNQTILSNNRTIDDFNDIRQEIYNIANEVQLTKSGVADIKQTLYQDDSHTESVSAKPKVEAEKEEPEIN